MSTQFEGDIPRLDGRSVLPLLAGRTTDRPIVLEVAGAPVLAEQKVATLTDESVYVQKDDQTELAAGTTPEPDWHARGIITADRWKYVRYPNVAGVEMYDLSTDPYELQNLAGNPAYADQQAALNAQLRAVQDCEGVACR